MNGFENLPAESLTALQQSVSWDVPERLNLAAAICDTWAEDRTRVALHWESESGASKTFTFRDMQVASDKAARAFEQLGIERGDIVSLVLPDVPELIVSMLGALKVGAIIMPVYHLFGPEGLSNRLSDCDPSLVVTNPTGATNLQRSNYRPGTVLTVDRDGGQIPSSLETTDFDRLIGAAAPGYDPVMLAPDDPGMLFYTSGSTGDPKGVLHGHRFVVGHRAIGTYLRDVGPNDLLFHTGNLSWAGGFVNLVEAWAVGASMFKYHGRFEASTVLSLLRGYEPDIFVTAPTAVRRFMDMDRSFDPTEYSFRLVAASGERVTADILRWIEENFGARARSLWGQTECFGVGYPPTADDWEEKRSSIGRVLPGFEAAVLDDDGTPLPDGEPGELCISRAPNPTMFLRYFDDPDETAAVRRGNWHRTGDVVYRDEDGYFWFQGRKDDIIISSGYRLSPVEIEATLNRHPAVKESAIIGVPDENRTEIARGYVELAAGYSASESVRDDVKAFVKAELAKFEYPREIRFLDELPKTTSGKIKRGSLRDRLPDAPEN